MRRMKWLASCCRLGEQMGLVDLPRSFDQLIERRRRRFAAYGRSRFTDKLLHAYRRAIGAVNFHVLTSLYPLLIEPELLVKLPLRQPRATPAVLKRVMAPLCRSGLINYVYRFAAPTPLREVVQTWTPACSLS